jgi:hypothetical protein
MFSTLLSQKQFKKMEHAYAPIPSSSSFIGERSVLTSSLRTGFAKEKEIAVATRTAANPAKSKTAISLTLWLIIFPPLFYFIYTINYKTMQDQSKSPRFYRELF